MEHLSGARPKKNNKRTDEAAANSIYAQVQFSDIILVKNIVLALLFDMDSRDTNKQQAWPNEIFSLAF